MEFNLDKHTTRRKSSSESLQRAIERNRAKRAKKQGNEPEAIVRPPSRSHPIVTARPAKTRAIVANSEESMFERELRSPRKKLPADISYSKSEIKKSLPRKSLPQKSLSTSRKRVMTAPKEREEKSFKEKFVDMMVYVGWVCCMILFVHLIVSERGVWDYYSRLRHFDELQNQFYQFQDSNQELMEEIQMISGNRSYQKKLIRDNLGFISSEEYLLLFSSRRKPTSI